MILEGRNAIKEALQGNISLEKVFIAKRNISQLSEIITELRNKNIKISYVNKPVLDKYSKTKNNQGIIAFASTFSYSSIEEVLNNKRNNKTLIIILDEITDPHNLGSILRIADSVGANGVIIPKHRACGVTDTVVNISSGAASHVKVARVTNINNLIRDLKSMHIKVLAADTSGQSVYKTFLNEDIAIVIGSEGKGVRPLTKKLSDEIVALPQLGKINSLNAAVAAGAILYECIRQRNEKT